MLKISNKPLLKFAVYLLTLLFAAGFILIGYQMFRPETSEEPDEQTYRAAIIEIISTIEEEVEQAPGLSVKLTTVYFEARLRSGPQKGEIVQAVLQLDDLFQDELRPVRVGDKILLGSHQDDINDETQWSFISYDRSTTMLYAALFFFILLVVFGRRKGLNTLLSLTITGLVIFLVYIPSIIQGSNIYFSSIIIATFIILVSLLILNGANSKSFCAIAGNLGGIAAAGISALLMSWLFHLTGIVNQESLFIVRMLQGKPIDLVAIIWGGVLIGALGAVMDVAMSIASAIKEVADNSRHISFKNLLQSGLNIGRDVMGTMTNTLILAYIGSSLALVILIAGDGRDLLLILNTEMIVVEIMQALAGSLGILAAIPITALVAAAVYSRGIKEHERKFIGQLDKRQSLHATFFDDPGDKI